MSFNVHSHSAAGLFVLFCLIRNFTYHQQSYSYVGTGLPGLNQYKVYDTDSLV